MANITINPEFKDRKVCHGKICKTVGDHTPAELKQLALQARKSENQILVQCFSELPELDELMAEKTAMEIAATKPAPPKPAETLKPTETPKV